VELLEPGKKSARRKEIPVGDVRQFSFLRDQWQNIFRGKRKKKVGKKKDDGQVREECHGTLGTGIDAQIHLFGTKGGGEQKKKEGGGSWGGESGRGGTR